MKATNERDYGIDLLRILTSFMVVIIHLLYYGDLAAYATPQSFSYYACYCIGIFFVCAVNCFGLISGYIGYSSEYKISNILKHQLTVVFFTLSITIISRLFSLSQITRHSIFTAFFPIISSTYWYYTAYAILFFLFPALNAAISTLKKRQLDFILFVSIVMLSIVPFISNQDIFYTKNGFSFLWLAVLYSIGAYLKKYHSHYKKRPSLYLAMYFFSVITTCLIKFIAEHVSLVNNGTGQEYTRLMEYTSPFILLSGISLLLLFSTLKLSPKYYQPISFFSRSSFSTYLIHEHPFIRTAFMGYPLRFILLLPAPVQIPALFMCGFVVWLICIALDQIRIILFKLLKVNYHTGKLESVFNSLRLYGQ